MTAKELRELDAWIAEHVMGWAKPELYQPPSEVHVDHEMFTPKPFLRSLVSGFWRAVPHHTTDPAAAMEVLKKCAEKTGFRITAQAVAGRWEVGLIYWENYEAKMRDVIEATTLELAICLFSKNIYSK